MKERIEQLTETSAALSAYTKYLKDAKDCLPESVPDLHGAILEALLNGATALWYDVNQELEKLENEADRQEDELRRLAEVSA